MVALDLKYYLTARGTSPFAEWFDALEPETRARIAVGLARMEAGNLATVKSVGSGVLENRMDFGPGYRVYFGRDGPRIVVLLCGGTKRRQQRDIEQAVAYWVDYKSRRLRM